MADEKHETSLTTPNPLFDAVIGRLTSLSKNHLLLFRLEVGREIAESFFQNDPALYADKAPNKENPFSQFLAERSQALEDLGLPDQDLRKCIRAWFVVKDLPPELVASLVFSHVNVLTQVHDPATRRLLAQATVDNRWTSTDLRNAVAAAREGKWIDGDPKTAGLQPPAPDPAAKVTDSRPPSAGRVVNKFEKSAEDFTDLLGQWKQVLPTGKLTKSQKRRVRGVVSSLRAWLDAVDKDLEE